MPLSASAKAYVNIPHKDSAIQFKHTFGGFKSANLLATMTSGTDLLKHIVAEDAELKAASDSPESLTGLDNSLKPRRLAVWIQANSKLQPVHADRLLDSMAHWSTTKINGVPLISTTRITVVGGRDSDSCDTIFNTSNSCTCPPEKGRVEWTFRVTIRWVDDLNQQQRTETAQMIHIPASNDQALLDVQQATVRLAGTYGAFLPRELLHNVEIRVPNHAFALNVARVHSQFDELLYAQPCVRLNEVAAARSGDSAPLETTGIVVRICERSAGSINSNTAFHGALLAFGGRKKTEAIAFAHDSVAENDGKLRVADDSLGLHTCAVQTQQLFLNCAVSLFGALGIAGVPVNSPCSFVYNQHAAIQPLDLALLDKFDVVPCAKWSIVPSEPALVEAFKRHFSVCTALFTSLNSKNEPQPQLHKSSTFDSSNSSAETARASISPLPAVAPAASIPAVLSSDDEDCDAVSQDNFSSARFLLAPFLVDFTSSRATIGEVYMYLADVNAPRNVRRLLACAAGSHGSLAPINCLVDLCAASLQNGLCEMHIPEIGENKRLRSLVAVAVAALADEPPQPQKRAKKSPLTISTTTEKLARVVHSSGLKKCASTVISREKSWNTNDRNVQNRILETLRSSADEIDGSLSATVDKILQKAKKGSNSEAQNSWVENFKLALANSVAILSLSAFASSRSAAEDVFFVTSFYRNCGEHEILIQKVTARTLLPSSIDEIFGQKTPKILILQVGANNPEKVKITSTSPLSS